MAKLDTAIKLEFDTRKLERAMTKLAEARRLSSVQVLERTSAAFLKSVVKQTPISVKKRDVIKAKPRTYSERAKKLIKFWVIKLKSGKAEAIAAYSKEDATNKAKIRYRGAGRGAWQGAFRKLKLKGSMNFESGMARRIGIKTGFANNQSKRFLNPFIALGTTIKYASKVAPNSVTNALAKTTSAMQKELDYYMAKKLKGAWK